MKFDILVRMTDNENLLHSCVFFFFLNSWILFTIGSGWDVNTSCLIMNSGRQSPPLILTPRRASLQPSPFPRTRSNLFILLGSWLAGRCPSWRVSKMAEKTARPCTARQPPVPRAYSHSFFFFLFFFFLRLQPSFKPKTSPPMVIIASFRVCHRLTNFSSPSMIFHLLQLKYWLRLYLFAFHHEQMTSGSLRMRRSYCDENLQTLLRAEMFFHDDFRSQCR